MYSTVSQNTVTLSAGYNSCSCSLFPLWLAPCSPHPETHQICQALAPMYLQCSLLSVYKQAYSVCTTLQGYSEKCSSFP